MIHLKKQSGFQGAFNLVLLIILLQITVSSQAMAKDLPTYGFFGDPSNKSESYYSFKLQEDLQKGFSLLTASTASSTKICNSVLDVRCSETGLKYSAETVLPVCEKTKSYFCIEGIDAEVSPGKTNNLIFKRYVDSQKFDSIGTSGLPEPSSISLWRLETDEGILEFSALATLTSVGQSGSAPIEFSPKRLQMQLNMFDLRTLPVAGRLEARELTNSQGVNSYTWNPLMETTNLICAWNEIGTCGAAQVHPTNLRFRVTLRIPKELPGWIYGRMSEADMKLDTSHKLWNVLTVEGSPAETMGIMAGTSFSSATPKMKTWLSEFSPISGNSVTLYESADCINCEALDIFKDILKDTGTLSLTRWSFYLNEDDKDYSRSACYKDQKRILGFVSTNAPIYSGKPPSFEDGSINYKVRGLHFAPNGSIFKGTYNLVMDSSFARCIYGFASAPIHATVQVISEQGENSIAVTNFTESLDGWVKFSATGFSFSSPTIKVRLEQELISQKSNIQLNKNSKLVKCVKARTVRIIKSKNAKCPTGFKKYY